MTELAIIADDLSGALDSAAPFAACGLRAVVALSPDALGKALQSGAEVVAVSTDSRDVEPKAARERVRAVLSQLPAGIKLFKKVDSRLKGNLESELDAFSFRNALVIPAIPDFGRWMRDGMLGGFGVTEPINIADRLGRHSNHSRIPNATTQDDIRAALDWHDYDLLIGARGLAEALAERMERGSQSTAVPRGGRAIFVIGSTDPITLEQVDYMRSSRSGVVHIPAPNGALPAAVPLTGDVTVLQATPGPHGAAPAAVARNLAAAVEDLVFAQGALLIISGGATAQVVLGHMGIQFVEVLGEVLPGLPLADAGRFKLITKSGGFGEPDVFLKVLERQDMGQ